MDRLRHLTSVRFALVASFAALTACSKGPAAQKVEPSTPRTAAVVGESDPNALKTFCDKSWPSTGATQPWAGGPAKRPGQPAAAAKGGWRWVSFWATWCAPCLEEMPLLDAFEREHRGAGWQVVGLSLDGAPAVQEFLSRTPVGFAIGLAQGQGVGLSRSLGNARGALPFSVAFNARGEAFARKLGALNARELSAWAAQVS